MALIAPGSDADLPTLAGKIEKKFARITPPAQIHTEDNRITILLGNYRFTIYLAESDHVLTESKEMAHHFKKDYAGNPVNKNSLQQCGRRFELSGEADFNMDYFNDSLYILECIEEFKEITILSMN